MSDINDDVNKMVTKLKGTKHRYRIEGGRYGGELAIGTVTPEFVNYWLSKEDEGDSELVETVVAHEWEDASDADPNSPDPGDNFSGWYETDDKEHINGPYADGGFIVTEVPADRSDDYSWDMPQLNVDAYPLYSREAYVSNELPDKDSEDECVPVLCFHSSEKGSFGCWFVDTVGEEFDPKKLAFSSVETDLAEIVENIWYDKQLLEQDFDFADTTGKGYYACVGYMNTKWHDSPDIYTEEFIEEGGYWECYDEDYDS